VWRYWEGLFVAGNEPKTYFHGHGDDSPGVWWWEIFRMTTNGRPKCTKSVCWLVCRLISMSVENVKATPHKCCQILTAHHRQTKHVPFIMIWKLGHMACRRHCSLFEKTTLYFACRTENSCDFFQPNEFYPCICKEFLRGPPPPLRRLQISPLSLV